MITVGKSGTFLVCFKTETVLSALGFQFNHEIAQGFLL